MLYLSLTLSTELFEANRDRLLHEASALVAEILRRSESTVCVSIQSATMLLAGKSDPSAFLELRSPDGLDANTNTVLSRKLCELLEREVDIAPDRVFLNFVEVNRAEWGWNAKTLPQPAPVRNKLGRV